MWLFSPPVWKVAISPPVWKLDILDLCYFLSHNHWVVIPDLLLAQGIVVEGAVVLVTVSMNGTEKVSTSTSEPCEPKLFLAAQATVLLGFLSRNRLIFFFFSICGGWGCLCYGFTRGFTFWFWFYIFYIYCVFWQGGVLVEVWLGGSAGTGACFTGLGVGGFLLLYFFVTHRTESFAVHTTEKPTAIAAEGWESLLGTGVHVLGTHFVF